MKKVILYTAGACHLCELALEQIEQSECFDQCMLTEVDIASDIKLLRQFSTRVPVMTIAGSSKHLFWPFDHYDVTEWLRKAAR